MSVRQTRGTPLRLLRADLDNWRGVRRNWRSMTADRLKREPPCILRKLVGGGGVPSRLQEYGADGFVLRSRPGGREIGPDWTALRARWSEQPRPGAVRDAFLRLHRRHPAGPARMVACYNSWWTLPKVVKQRDNLALIRELKAACSTGTGSSSTSSPPTWDGAIRAASGRSTARSFPQGFDDIRAIVEPAGGKLGIWMSPSELYPPVCDYDWAEKSGYVVLRPERESRRGTGLARRARAVAGRPEVPRRDQAATEEADPRERPGAHQVRRLLGHRASPASRPGRRRRLGGAAGRLFARVAAGLEGGESANW